MYCSGLFDLCLILGDSSSDFAVFFAIVFSAAFFAIAFFVVFFAAFVALPSLQLLFASDESEGESEDDSFS